MRICISYSLYLWHWPLLTFTRIVLGTNPTRLQATAVLAVSFLAAAASYKWIEQPFRRTRTPGGRLLLRYAAVTTCLILVCLGVRTTFGMAFRAPELALEEKLDWPSGDPCVVHPPANRPNTSVQCFENTGRPALALWGDSHAGSLALALRQQAHTAGYDFIEASESSCPSLANTGLYYPESPDEAEDCIAFNNKVLDSFDADRNIQIVVLASYWTDPLVDPYEHDKAWIVTGAEPRGPKPGFEDCSPQAFSPRFLRCKVPGRGFSCFKTFHSSLKTLFGASELSIYHSESRSQIDFTRVSPPIPERRLR